MDYEFMDEVYIKVSIYWVQVRTVHIIYMHMEDREVVCTCAV